MPTAVRHNGIRRDGFSVAACLASIMALTLLLPAALRRRRGIREVDVEVIPPDETPFVVQLLSTGELPGVNADPHPPDDRGTDSTPQLRPEPPQVEAVGVPEQAEPEATIEPVATPREPEPPSEEPEPLPPAAETPSTPVPPRAAKRERRATTQRAHPPQRHVAPARPPAVHTQGSEPPPAPGEAMCEIRFWRGYRKANFYACVFSVDGETLAVAESPFFRARGGGMPEQTEEAVAAYDALRQRLEQSGWEHAASGRTWFGDVYSRSF
jgi:hypothetical protein